MKKIIALSVAATLATTLYASDDLKMQIEMLKAQIEKLEKQVEKNNKSIKKNKENVNAVKILANNDNIKWDVDFRTAYDNIQYKHASGAVSKNPDLLTNRLWLGMGYAPDANNIFKGKLSYFKAYGDSANHSQANTNPGYANFDWVTNENANDNTIKVKEAYWLYMNDTFLGSDVAWTASVGRRPSTDGLGINLREGMKDNSPLSHTVNVEFDGASFKFNLDKVTGVPGMWWKACLGRGLTNAKPRFSMSGTDYAKDDTYDHDVNMYGFIFVPYDNGQYSLHTNWAKADNMIGMTINPNTGVLLTDGTYGTPTMTNPPKLSSFGSLELFTAMFKAEGIGNGISDYLDDTRLFVSWAQSKTDPRAGKAMLGSTESQTGSSTWVGLNVPCVLSKDGRIGVEWNKGSKYWRSVTYGEDTMAGSKIAARGTAWEVYYTKPLTKALTFNARYTDI
ncbi:MAG: DUF3373 family protein, partial [Campylobacterales bacterium]|nr:DUF3373 family protein [Campylobacterales bacterium]